MKIAVVIAAGVGERTGQQIPKQFIHVLDKPIIIYTLEKFQNSPEIDAIEVVCLSGWEEVLKTYAVQYGIAKLKWIVPGGASGQESIYKGLLNLRNECSEDDIVVIHDGIRPMVEERILKSCIEICEKKGNGITALPVYEQIFRAEDEEKTTSYIPREQLRILQTPQAYQYGMILRTYEEAYKSNVGLHSSSYANTLMADLGHPLYFAEGSTKNIKITTKDDIEIFKAMLESSKG
ncbi:MAG: 2-C-methyl-D-erythritol 4-phosphate cytidylyltransferase [Lachnospiraceae bacterium]|nr:2-C-methyl-D-erythritol 4-phosphate cytidylyltransferase [Lachnospiraceae bacterium]